MPECNQEGWLREFQQVTESSTTAHPNPFDPNTLNGNNYASRPIAVLQPPPQLPDLVVASAVPDASAAGGGPFTVRWTVLNQGNAAASGGAWLGEIYLSDSPVLKAPGSHSSLLGAVSHSDSLAIGGNYNPGIKIDMQLATLFTDTYFSDDAKHDQQMMRKAKSLAHVLDNIPIFITDRA